MCLMCIDHVVKKLSSENANFNGCLEVFTDSCRTEMSAHIHMCPSTEFTIDICGMGSATTSKLCDLREEVIS